MNDLETRIKAMQFNESANDRTRIVLLEKNVLMLKTAIDGLAKALQQLVLTMDKLSRKIEEFEKGGD